MRRISTSTIGTAVLVVLIGALFGCSRAVGQRAGESITREDAPSDRVGLPGVAGPTPTPYACPGCWQFVTQDENFDSVMPPALPPDWLATNAQGPPPLWVTSNSGVPMPPADSFPNALYIDDPPVVSDKLLDGWFVDFFEDCCVLLVFRHNFNLEASEVDPHIGYDGGVLEMSTDGGNTFQDILAAGGSFVTGGYNRTIATDRGSPIAGRQAWSGNSGGFITTAVNVPFIQEPGRLRWRMASDDSGGNEGWRVDTLHMTWCKGMGPPCTPTPTPPATPTPTASGTPTITPTPPITPTPTPPITPTATPTVTPPPTPPFGTPTPRPNPTPRPRHPTPLPRPTPPG